MSVSKILLAGCVLLPVLAQGADIFRCAGPQGVPRFQHGPCVGGEAVELQPPAARWEPLRQGERELWEEGRRRERSHSSKRQPVASHSERASPQSCLRKRQQADTVSAQLRHGYAPAEGGRLHRRRDELEEYLRRFCD